MARRRRDDDNQGLERDDDIIASLAAPIPPVAPLVLTPGYLDPWEDLRAFEDRRTYHPDGFFRPAQTTTGGRASYRRKHSPNGTSFPRHTSFHAFDNSVLVCVRRKQRREVIFAKRKRRKGAGARRRRRNYYSNVRC